MPRLVLPPEERLIEDIKLSLFAPSVVRATSTSQNLSLGKTVISAMNV